MLRLRFEYDRLATGTEFWFEKLFCCRAVAGITVASSLIDSSVAANSGGAGETEVVWDRLLFVEAMAGCLVYDWVIVDEDGGGGVREDSFCFAFSFQLFFFTGVKGVLPP